MAIDWDAWEATVRGNGVVIDRPRGIPHPRYPASIYPVDYGYIPGTIGGDGREVDVFVGTASGRGLSGLIATRDTTKRDEEVKLLWNLTDAEVAAVLTFLNRGGMSGRLVARPQPGSA
jgi:inorganic pyrophosphatase